MRTYSVYFSCIFLFCVQTVSLYNISEPVVQLSLGKIEGGVQKSVSGRMFYSFEGVPYAKPPVGENRFREPLALEPWTYIRKAKTVTRCLQYRHLSKPYTEHPIIGNEDCLYLNIYTPTLNQTANLNVIVFIHGGAFMFNYGAFHGPRFFLNNDVVYVNFNYRLGIFGFISTEDDIVPGNNGLKDQIEALKWIQEHIKYFGGNPRSVTITGNSAGGASVHFHYLITKSRGLFHNGISQSGTSLNPWVLMENALEKTKKVAALVNCPTNASKGMIDCMKQRDGRQITETTKYFLPWLYNPFSPFGVVVDTWSSDPLLQEHPYQLLKKKFVYDVPWLASHVSSEGLYPAAEFYRDENNLNDIDKKWKRIIPHILDFNYTVDCRDLYEVGAKIRQHYLGKETVSKRTYDTLVQIIGDRLFVVDIHKSVKLHAAATYAPVYMYYFAYRGQNSRSDSRSKSKVNFGAAHGDDASYIFEMNLNTRINENDTRIADLLVNIWLSFAATGKPSMHSTIEWSPVSRNGDGIKYLKIDSSSNLSMDSNENLGHPEFWNSLPFRENEKLFEKQIKDEF